MNITSTITFETVTVEALLDDNGVEILPASQYDSFVVRLYNADLPNPDGSPFIYQPMDHRTSKPFSTEEEAEDWVSFYLTDFLNPPTE